MYRCISWIAVSSKPQYERESPVEQRALNAAFVESLGERYLDASGEIVHTFDLAVSRSISSLSEAMERIPAYTELVAMAKAHKFDLLICRSRDRLGRTLPLIATLERICLLNGIVVVPRNNPPRILDARELRRSEMAPLIGTIEASMAEIEIRRLVARSEMGIRARVVDRGLFANRLPYGYEYVYSADGEKTLEIVPEQTAVIRHALLDLYLKANWSRVKINGYLKERFADAEPVAFETILHNLRAYGGYIDFNRQSKRGRERTLVKGNHPPILSAEEMEAVLTARVGRHTPATGDAARRPFRHIVRCALCGAAMIGRVQTIRARHGSVKHFGMRCHHCCTNITEARLIAALRDLAATPEKWLAAQPPADADEEETRCLHQEIDEHTTQRDAVRRKRTRLIDYYIARGTMTVDALNAKLDPLEQRLLELDQRIRNAQRAFEAIHLRGSRDARLGRLFDTLPALLDNIERDPLAVRDFLIDQLRIHVGRGGQIKRIELL